MAHIKKRKTRRRKKALLRMLLLVCVISFVAVGGTATYFIYKLSNVTANTQVELDRGDKSERREQPVDPSKDNISVLILGLDDRDGELRGRTDAMLLATFNKELGSIKLLNIPRDSLVEIPGRLNRDKINHAHAFGGLEMTINTVENLFDIPVDYYVSLNFIAFMEIIDALGGVEVEVPFTFSEMNSNDEKGTITLYEGMQTLNGEEALAFSRMRKQDPRGDHGRGERQQEVIKGIISKAASLSSITSYGDIMDSLESHLATNLSFGNILALHSYSSALNDIESLTLRGTDVRINGGYYYDLTPDSVDELSKTFQSHLGLIEIEEPLENQEEETPSY
ncbi:LCP family glycopolymer transferase [Halalkalibacter okhensis]|uniref:Transcriptional regulator n=1 Tax=Halalkalibacter okhensis TaxID=333138 RepID=A0A0B0IHP9_9BACI|nr:LCP family protein [Halalkalibacter okhensis]KHF39604.1 transcriptional regulator [Halalkalibacter okhensis]